MTGKPTEPIGVSTQADTACETASSCPSGGVNSTTSEAQQAAPRRGKADRDGERRCIVTRQALPPEAMIRFVVDPSGQLVADLARKLPGRGVWVTAGRSELLAAIKREAFAKSLKKPVKIDKDLIEKIEGLLAEEARQLLSLANKAGLVTIGFSKVEAALQGGHVDVLVSASDASDDSAGKLARKFKAIRSAKGLDVPILRDFTGAELSLAIGGSNVIHAALTGGGLTRRVIASAERWRRVRRPSTTLQLMEDDAGQTDPPTGSPARTLDTQPDA